MTWTFFFNITLHKEEKKNHHSNRQEARAAGRAVVTAQHLSEITASRLLRHQRRLLLGEQSTENLPFWKHMLSNRTWKNPDGISFK